jgi:hypothetical protein
MKLNNLSLREKISLFEQLTTDEQRTIFITCCGIHAGAVHQVWVRATSQEEVDAAIESVQSVETNLRCRVEIEDGSTVIYDPEGLVT